MHYDFAIIIHFDINHAVKQMALTHYDIYTSHNHNVLNIYKLLGKSTISLFTLNIFIGNMRWYNNFLWEISYNNRSNKILWWIIPLKITLSKKVIFLFSLFNRNLNPGKRWRSRYNSPPVLCCLSINIGMCKYMSSVTNTIIEPVLKVIVCWVWIS